MEITQEVFLKLLLSVVVGGIIGIEREFQTKSAGFRTLMLICLGANLFSMLSVTIGEGISPDRIASNIVVGIGFVGAGVIFKGENQVNGITTAASIWVTAALGMAIGAGYEWWALTGTAFVLAVLYIFRLLEDHFERSRQLRTYRIVSNYEMNAFKRFEEVFSNYKLTFKKNKQSKNADRVIGTWVVKGSEKNHQKCIDQLLTDPGIIEFEC